MNSLIPATKTVCNRLALLALALLGTVPASRAQQSNLSCSLRSVPLVNGITPSFTVTQSNSSSGTSTWLFPARTIDADTTNFATGTIGLTGALTLRVTDAANTYASGDFAGFTLASSLINLSALGSLQVRTYLNGIQQEAVAGSNLSATAAGISGAYQVGFYTNLPFNAVEIQVTSTNGIGSYFLYNALLRGTGSCTSAALACNIPTLSQFPTRASVLQPARTGVTGLSVGALSNPAATTDDDAATYATLTTTTAVLGTAAISVKDATTTHPAGTVAGFDLENATLLAPNTLGGVTINIYRDDVLKQSRSGSGLTLSATVAGTAGRQVVGFVADSTFDEVQVAISQTAVVSLGTTRIYGAVVKRLCATAPLTPGKRNRVSDATSAISIAAASTGFTGAACVSCALTNVGNLIDADTTNMAVLSLTPGVLVTGQVAIRDAVTDYVPGTFAGYDLENAALLNSANLPNLSLRFYRDGVLKQTISGSSLQLFASGTSSNRRLLGYTADSTFDQVQMAMAQTVGMNWGTTNMYGMVLAAPGTSLPVRLVAFSGTGAGCDALLNWETGAEDPGTAFAVEASTDGRAFEPVAQVAGHGNTTGDRYTWTGTQTAPAAFYRLRSTDASGEAAYSSTVVVKIRCGDATPTAYPNPATDQVTLRNLPQPAVVDVYNALGQRVLRIPAATATQTLDLRGMPAGRYQLRILGAAGPIDSLPLLVQP